MVTQKDNQSKNHHAVTLDEASFSLEDIDLTALLNQVSSWNRYAETDAAERLVRLSQATIVVINKVKLDAALIKQLPRLQLVLLTGTGTDKVDLFACRQQGITVCNVTNYGTPSVAQHALSLMLALSTNLLQYAEEVRSGAWSKETQFSTLSHSINELEGKVLGLVGYGALAKGVEKLALAFGMQVLISGRPGGEPQKGRVPFEQLLEKVDVLSLHCPLTDETRHLMNADAFKKMKSTAILINTARGAVVDNAALADALRQGDIKGAGIDVLEQEPPPADHPLLQPDVPNVIATPHVAWASIEARQRLLNKVADNLSAWLVGQPINVVN